MQLLGGWTTIYRHMYFLQYWAARRDARTRYFMAKPILLRQMMSQRFTVQKFAADGGFSLAGAALLVVLAFATAAVLGVVASIVGRWFYLILLFPAIIGALVGFVALWAIQRGHVRNVMIAGAAGFLAGCTAMLTMHVAEYLHFKSEIDGIRNQLDPADLQVIDTFPEVKANLNQQPPEVQEMVKELEKEPVGLAALRVRTFPQFVDYSAQQGVSIGRAVEVNRDAKKGMNLGYIGTYIYWGVEVLIVACIAFGIAASAAKKPYCLECNSWKTSQVLGSVQPPAESAVDALQQGDLSLLTQNQPSSEEGQLLVSASVCSACGDHSTVDVKLENVTLNKKGEVQKKELAHVTYPQKSLPAISALFKSPSETTAPAPFPTK
jgi:hypothetical protein